MDLKAFAARLKELREEARLSQRQLAERAGCSPGSLANWEQGIREPGWLAVLALAGALGVDCKAFEQKPAQTGKAKRGRPKKAKPEPKPKKKGEGKGRKPRS